MDTLTAEELSARTGLEPWTLQEMLRRVADPGFERWSAQVDRCGHCARPIRLRGRVLRDGVTVYSSAKEPDGVTYLRCRNRRASVCPPCSYEYAGDMWQLLYAGVAGGRKGVPESVASHPLVFVTLTAPSFGPVHGVRDDEGRCRARRRAKACPHGRRIWCSKRHDRNDAHLGEPLCPDCYDYSASVLFNWHAPELWRRFTIALQRVLARELGLSGSAFRKEFRVSFAKVAELQRRGVVHFHAIVRLDAAEGQYQPPPLGVDAEILERAVRLAARRVRLAVAGDARQNVVLSFGSEVDVQSIRSGLPTGELTGEVVAAYVAKYATKAAEDFGIEDRAISPVAARRRGLSDHVVRLVDTAHRLSSEVEELARLRCWTHMLGFRGHFATKSRRYSTTLGCLRRTRAEYCRKRELGRRGVEIEDVEGTTLVMGEWAFAGVGWATRGDAVLAASAAAGARECRLIAREEAA